MRAVRRTYPIKFGKDGERTAEYEDPPNAVRLQFIDWDLHSHECHITWIVNDDIPRQTMGYAE